MGNLKKRLKLFFKWYIKGEYHCDKCPYCWCDWNTFEGDGDAGCYIKGELHDNCRLIPPVRHLLGWGKKKRTLYAANHEYDGFGEWYMDNQGQEEAMRKSIWKHILPDNVYLVTTNAAGDKIELDKRDWLELHVYKVRYEYEEYAHPFSPPPKLSALWRTVIKETWKRFLNTFAPYFE